MIKVTEQPTKKMPGETSLFVQFEYNPAIVEVFKTFPQRQFHKDIKAWEVPITLLSQLLDTLSLYDEIQFTWMPDKKVKKDKVFELQEYKTKPFPYQLDAIQYGLNHNKFLLLDEPGLGKTLEIIYIAQELKARENIEHCLIICGVNTLKTNWKSEIQRHSDLSCHILGERINKKGRTIIGSIKERLEDLKHPLKEFFVITNVETIREPDIVKAINDAKHNTFDMIVFDELHVAKSNISQQGKNLLKLNKAKYKIGATGTLLLNNPCDCYVPLKWIEKEKSTMSNFEYHYCIYGGAFGHDLLGYKNIDFLKDELATCSLRRTKDILDLPPKTIITEQVDMEPTQRTFYENIKNGIIDEVDKVDLNPACVLSMVTRLRQATACPSVLTSENISSAKVERACDLAEQICSDGSKLVIFSTFKETANVLYQKLKAYHPLLCTGDVPDVVIANNIKTFQEDDEHKIFIATWQKCGTGITLTRASTSIFIDTPWTDAVWSQAQDRIYRIGTKNPVFIYNLVTTDSVDERVNQIVQDKKLIGEYIIDNKVSPQLASRLKEIITDLK